MSCKVSVRHRLHQHIIVSAGRSLISLLDPMADDGVTRLAYCRCKSRSSSQMQKPLKLTSEKRRESLPAVCCSWLPRSEEHTSELQSLMRISYAVFCLKKKKNKTHKMIKIIAKHEQN